MQERIMKVLFKMTLMSLLAVGLVSCGEQNESSGGKKSSNSFNEIGEITGSGTNYNDPDQLLNTLRNRSLRDGARINDPVYHIGSYFGGQSSQNISFDLGDLFDFNFSTCFVFNGNASGDCNQNGQGLYGTQLTNNLVGLINNGEYKVIKDLSDNAVGLDIADSVSNGQFSFNYTSYDRNDDTYKDMMNSNNKAVRARIMTDAQINLTNGQQIRGEYLEYFFEDGTKEGYVISTSFPTVANPILVTRRDQFSGRDVVVGALDFMGANRVRVVTATSHTINYDYQTNTWRPISTGQIQF